MNRVAYFLVMNIYVILFIFSILASFYTGFENFILFMSVSFFLVLGFELHGRVGFEVLLLDVMYFVLFLFSFLFPVILFVFKVYDDFLSVNAIFSPIVIAAMFLYSRKFGNGNIDSILGVFLCNKKFSIEYFYYLLSIMIFMNFYSIIFIKNVNFIAYQSYWQIIYFSLCLIFSRLIYRYIYCQNTFRVGG